MQTVNKSTNNLKAAIPHGGIGKIAKAAGVSLYTASRVINGHVKNAKVSAAVNVYLKALKAELKETEALAAEILGIANNEK